MFRISARFIFDNSVVLTTLGIALFVQSLMGVASAQTLLPDTMGKVDSVVVSVNSARRSTLRNASLITNIVNALPDHTHVSIITNDRAAFTVARNRLPERVGFIEIADDNPITIWPQDPFLVVSDTKKRPYLLKPKSFERSGDAVMADRIAESTGLQVVQSSLYFEGGNIVSDEDHVFIGANTIHRNAVELKQTEIDIVKKFESELGRRVLVVGPYPQASAHIDMLLTPLGSRELVVADAGLGADIIQGLLDSSPAKVTEFEEVNEKNFFGSPSIVKLSGEDGEVITPPRLAGKTGEMIALSREMAPILDGIAEAFTGFGYRVHRVPYLFGGPEAVTAEEYESGQIVAYPMLTYNNVILEEYKGRKAVYLPEYNMEPMDEAAARLWESLGYTVHPVQGLAISSMYGGALRCSVKVLSRTLTN